MGKMGDLSDTDKVNMVAGAGPAGPTASKQLLGNWNCFYTGTSIPSVYRKWSQKERENIQSAVVCVAENAPKAVGAANWTTLKGNSSSSNRRSSSRSVEQHL